MASPKRVHVTAPPSASPYTVADPIPRQVKNEGNESNEPNEGAGETIAAEGDLAQSLQHLSITSSTSPTPTPLASTSLTTPIPSPSVSPSSARSGRRSSRPPALSPNNQQHSQPRPPVRSSSTPRPSSGMRSPLHASSASASASERPPSRSATPSLLRKASMNSLHSVNGVAPPRRASSINVLSPARGPRSPLRSLSPEIPERPPPPTAQLLASTHFQGELKAHHAADSSLPTDTVVFLHDDCYGHRYSRPRTSRATLSTIVERPERIKASVLGVAAAYVRLGDRHQDGAFPIQQHSSPAALSSIPFRIQKTTRRLSLTSPTVTNVHGTKWMEELKIMCDSAEAKLTANGKELQRPEMDRGPNAEAPRVLHEGDLYLCSESLNALEGALGGVCDAVDAVFAPQGPKRAFVAIRPPGHHCSASYPSGFCWINNVHVGIMHAIMTHGLTHAAIIDFDLHHGDGSQAITWQHNSRSLGLHKNAAQWKKTSIGYFSLHDINSYPCELGDEEKVKNASICIENAHAQNIWNVHLQPWKTEADFWELYESKYSVLLEKVRIYLKGQTERFRGTGIKPKAAIFLSAGFDASEWESAGMQRHSVNVPTEFYARLTRDVVRIAEEEGTSVEGRVISALEGGYSDRALCSGVMSHVCGLAGDAPTRQEASRAGEVDHDMIKDEFPSLERKPQHYEPSWWSRAELERLEAVLSAPPPPPPETRKPRNVVPPTYSSPTQSSTAKVVTPRHRRTSGALMPGTPVGMGYDRSPMSRSPTPPPPDIPWTIAAHELSKLLIPSERQTDSCKHEDLNAEATRARRDRQAALAAQSVQTEAGTVSAVPAERPPTRMALRERKAKASALIDEETEEDRKARRTTVAGTTVIANEKAIARGKPAGRQPGRRLSAASTIVPESIHPEAPPVPVPSLPQKVNSVRPDTSLSIRPESSISVRVANSVHGNDSALNVKKTRAPAKKEPAPRAVRAPRKAPGTSTTAAGKTSSAAPSPEASPPRQEQDPMDGLTNDMKKVKITLVTMAQKEARERERLAKERLGNSDVITVITTPREENKPFPQQQRTPASSLLSSSSPGTISTAAGGTATPLSSPPSVDHREGLGLSSTSPKQQGYFQSQQQQQRSSNPKSPVELPKLTDPTAAVKASSDLHLQVQGSFSTLALDRKPQLVPLPNSSPTEALAASAKISSRPDTPSTRKSPVRRSPIRRNGGGGGNRPASYSSSSPTASSTLSTNGGGAGSTSTAGVTTPDIFIQYQPDGPMSTISTNSGFPFPSPPPQQQQQQQQQRGNNQQQQQQLQWLPPNTAGTPMRKADLPVFSPTGNIPFAGTSAGPSGGGGAAPGSSSPSTPRGGGVGASGGQRVKDIMDSLAARGVNLGNINNNGENPVPVKRVERDRTQEIPETPQH